MPIGKRMGRRLLPYVEKVAKLGFDVLEISLRDIGYDGAVVMEPFVNRGGKIGSDIHIWCDLPEGRNPETLGQGAQNALAFSRFVLG